MSCYRSILVAYDGSSQTEAVVHHAASLAAHHHARLVILTVTPHPRAVWVVPGPSVIVPDFEREFATALRDVTRTIPSDVGVEPRLAYGKAAAKIVDVAHQLDSDLIVMRCCGHGRLREAIGHCTQATVVRESRIPVLLVRPEQHRPAVNERLRVVA